MPLPNLKKKSKPQSFLDGKFSYGLRKRIYSEKKFIQVLEIERERSNRNKHHFSLIVLKLGLKEKDETTSRSCIHQITKRLRIIDEIGWYGPEHIGIILPYTSSAGARSFAESMIETMDSNTPISNCTIFTYPPGCDVD